MHLVCYLDPYYQSCLCTFFTLLSLLTCSITCFFILVCIIEYVHVHLCKLNASSGKTHNLQPTDSRNSQLISIVWYNNEALWYKTFSILNHLKSTAEAKPTINIVSTIHILHYYELLGLFTKVYTCYIFTPCACTRGKVIGFVCLSSISTKITRSEDSGITMVSKCDQIVESSKKLFSFCYLTLGTRYECYKSCNYIGYAYQPYLARPCASSTAHA